MQPAEAIADNSESQDGPSHHTNPLTGYYDAEKCRAYIANQSRVSKIDRFAVQVHRALEIETDVHSRIANVLNMFKKRSAQVAHDFSLKCKLGSQRHRQDRILNQSKRGAKRQNQHQHQYHHQEGDTPTINMSNDLLYGQGAQLVHELLNQPMLFLTPKHIKRKGKTRQVECKDNDDPLKGTEFEPSVYVDMLENSIRNNMKKSKAITNSLLTLQQLFKTMAAEHRDKVDLVYAAEEERQASTVIRRSAYNLSVAAIKATSTPMST